METVEVVIRLPKEAFERIYDVDHLVVKEFVKNGTPLPKGHGRLADLDAALKCVEDCEDCEDKTFAIALFDWAMSKRVVLKADKEAEDD